MKKLLLVLSIIVVVVLAVVAGGIWYANRYLQTPAFKEYVLKAAREQLGTDITVQELDASLFSGVSLKGIMVANPPGFSGQLLEAQAFVLRYRLLPLLQKRVEITTLSIQQPVITLVRNAQGEWNYDKLGGPAPTNQPPPAATTTTAETAPPAPAGTAAPPVDVSLSKLELVGAGIAMLGADKQILLSLQDVNLNADVQLRGGKLSGTGQASIRQVSVAEKLFVSGIAAPVRFTGESVRLEPLRGTLAQGNISGNVDVRVLGGTKYAVKLDVREADMTKLLEEAKTKPVMQGKLQIAAQLEGTAGLATINGAGQANITGGKLAGVPLLNTLATLLQINELRNLEFSECRFEFTMANNQMPTPVISVVSPQVRLTGKGVVSLADYALNHDLTLAVAPGVLAKVPKEVRAVFAQQPDGFLALSFHVSGPYDAPKTDIPERLLKGAGQQLLEKGLEKLFK